MELSYISVPRRHVFTISPMDKLIAFKSLLTIAFLTIAIILVGQSEMPYGLSNSGLPILTPTQIQSISYQEVENRDKANNWQDRVSVPTDVSLDLKKGEWYTMQNGDRLWRMHLQCKNAKGLAIMLRDVSLPSGATLQLYAQDGKHILQQIDQTNVNPEGNLLIGPVIGSNAILEYFEPASVKSKGDFDLFKIQRLYKDYLPSIDNGSSNRAFGDAWACQVNLACDNSGNFDDVERSVSRILMVVEEGMLYCTGSLINNTAQDMTPYILTAFHCANDFTPMYEFFRFDFNFTSPFCTNPAQEPPYQSLLGCARISGNADSDFELLRLFQSIPSSFNAYFAGWNRTQDYLPDTTTLIHHPSGDIKKISQDYNRVLIFNSTIDWDNGTVTSSRSHYRSFPDLGAFQGGSSGSPYLDNNGHIIGQLHGGDANCEEPEAFSGLFVRSWTGAGSETTRLSNWLDPIGAGNLIQNGLDPNTVPPGSGTISGRVVFPNGEPMDKAIVYLTTDNAFPRNPSSLITTVTTGPDGFYSFAGVPMGQNYYISASNDRCKFNGLSVSDITRVLNHLTFTNELSSPEQFIVADINNDGVITVFDVVFVRALLLGVISEFPAQESFVILRSDMVFEEENPLTTNWQQNALLFEVTNLSGPALVPDFTAYKVGDVTFSASSTSCN